MSAITLAQSSVFVGGTIYNGGARNCFINGGSGSGWGANKFMYAYNNGSSIYIKYSYNQITWFNQIVYSPNGNRVNILLDSNQNPYVIVRYFNAGINHMVVTYYNGSSWVSSSFLASDSAWNNNYPLTAVMDAHNNINIFYLFYDGINSKIGNAKFNTTTLTWSDSIILSSTIYQYNDILAQLDSSGNFNLFFQDGFGSGVFYLNTKNNIPVQVDSGGVIRDIKIDALGNIHFIWGNTDLTYNYLTPESVWGTPIFMGYVPGYISGPDALMFVKNDNSLFVLVTVVGSTSSNIYYLTKTNLSSAFSAGTLFQVINAIDLNDNPTIIAGCSDFTGKYVYYLTADDAGAPS